jgi:S-DNA-T family DNA segregation ATPase FtsK/SpoIIIE
MHRIQETLINSKPSFNGSKGGDIPVKPSYAEEEEREEEREEEATKPAWRKIFPASRKVKQEEPTLSGLEPPVQSPSLKPVEATTISSLRSKRQLHVPKRSRGKVEKTMPSVSNAALDGDAGGEPGEDVEILEDYDRRKISPRLNSPPWSAKGLQYRQPASRHANRTKTRTRSSVPCATTESRSPR